jgi:N-carbamoyl-L-amino-acid hydrolase
MSNLAIDAGRMLGRLKTLGEVGRDGEGRLARIAATDADKAGRDMVVGWFKEAGLTVEVDRIGNIFGIWSKGAGDPIMLGSHIDTVVNAGIYDGNYGVIAGLEVIQTLQSAGFTPARPIVVGAFTNEEGARFAPDMMGSLVYAGGMNTDEALAVIGNDGKALGDELRRIGYAGAREPGFMKPHAYVELHIEQGPVLERIGIPIGAVENLQGISWHRVTIGGTANHAGTTPMSMRQDAGHAMARVMTFLRDYATDNGPHAVATVGNIKLEPNVINVIPSKATFTVDLRDPDEGRLKAAEAALKACLDALSTKEGVKISVERLARFEPVQFDGRLVDMIEVAARSRQLATRRMTSGAGHDAQMIARIAPSAMIFVPSKAGISHNPREHTAPDELVAGANVFLDVVRELSAES